LRIYKLEQNYRSTQNIVNAANSLIRKNKGQISKTVFSENEQGHKIRILPAYSDYEEGYLISSQILDTLMAERCAYADFAVLYRTNAQSRVVEEALRRKNIPYRVYGGQSFYQRKEVKDLIAYFRAVVNPHDEEALKRIINFPTRGIGDTTVRKLLAAATIHQVSMWQILCNPVAFSVPVTSGTLKKLTDFREMIEQLMKESSLLSADAFALMIAKESGIASELYQDRSIEGISRQENLQEVLKAVTEFCAIKREEGDEYVSLSDFLIEVALITDQDEDNKENPNRVTLMTAHSAKGLEFDHVFIAGLEENLFPSARTLENPNAIEEERRLLYVAITRAKRCCVITYAERRFRNGENMKCIPSRFLNDIDTQYLILPDKLLDDSRFASKGVLRNDFATNSYSSRQTELNSVSPRFQGIAGQTRNDEYVGKRTLKKIEPSESAPSEKVNSLGDFTVGDKVRHDRFGKGEIISLEGSEGNAKAVIEFEHSGQKTLFLKYAILTMIKH
jgi:DNA helicase-2/ATP-dependent DNA helicase PcrA